jgi:hypothetical protein
MSTTVVLFSRSDTTRPAAMTSTKHEIAAEAVKAAPPITVAGATVAGVPVNELILWATLLYLVLQIVFLLYRWWRLGTGRDNGDGGA